MWSITRTSTGAFVDSSLSPRRSWIAVKMEGGASEGVGLDAAIAPMSGVTLQCEVIGSGEAGGVDDDAAELAVDHGGEFGHVVRCAMMGPGVMPTRPPGV